jgi:hypothetical protein
VTSSGPPDVTPFALGEQVGTHPPGPRIKLAIAGSRGLCPSPERISRVIAGWLSSSVTICEIVSGHARGVDRAGELWAARCRLPCVRFPARWAEYGRSAGVRRNEQIAQYADALLAFWDGRSPGTRDVLARFAAYSKPIRLVEGA